MDANIISSVRSIYSIENVVEILTLAAVIINPKLFGKVN